MATASAANIAAVRRFNRAYTRRIGMLRQRLYDSSYSLAQVRVLYELANAATPPTARSCATSTSTPAT